MVAVSSLGVILAAGYVLWMVQRVFYGEVTNPKNQGLPDLSAREAAVLVPLVVLAIVMGVASPVFTRRIEPSVDALVRQVRERTLAGPRGGHRPAAGGSRRGGAAMTGAVLDLRPLAPAAIVAVTGLVVLLTQAFTPRGKESPSAPLAFLGLAAALGSVWVLATGPGRGSVLAGALTADDFSLFFHALVLGVAAITVLLSPSYLRANGMERGEYYALLLFSTVGMLGLVSSLELVSLFVALEIMSIALYGMAGLHRGRPRSQESALKYFVTGAFASAFFLYGIALLYGATGSTSLEKIARSVSVLSPGSLPLAVLGVAMLLVGFGFKVASVPFHMWAPDVYEGAPTTVTGFISAGLKAAAFGALLRVFESALPGLASHWQPLVGVLAIVSMVVGNLAALAQTSLKRMLAYSSIAHAGYLLTAFVAAPLVAGEAMLFYLVAYAAVNLGAFGALAALSRDGESRSRSATSPASPTAARRSPPRSPSSSSPSPASRSPPVRRQVLPLRRRGVRGLDGHRARPGGRRHECRLGLLLPSGGGGHVHERAGRGGHLGPGFPGLGLRAGRLGRAHASPRRVARAAPRPRPRRRPQPDPVRRPQPAA